MAILQFERILRGLPLTQTNDTFLYKLKWYSIMCVFSKHFSRFSYPFIHFNSCRIPYPLIYLKPEKRYPFRAEPPRIGHYGRCPPGGLASRADASAARNAWRSPKNVFLEGYLRFMLLFVCLFFHPMAFKGFQRRNDTFSLRHGILSVFLYLNVLRGNHYLNLGRLSPWRTHSYQKAF